MTDNRSHRRPDVTMVDIIGGPEKIVVTLEPHNTAWVGIYEAHRRRILDAVTAVNIEVEHIGSTSVPQLAAKPIVDILVTVEDITAEEDYLQPLLEVGYELRVREPGHRLVRTASRDVHVHILEWDHPEVSEYLLLRDHLRSEPRDRALYETTKTALLTRQWDDMNDYADAKTAVIVEIKERARAARGW